MWELGLIVLVALIFLGPRQLTETARVLGRLYREVTKLTSELRNSIDLDAMTSTTASPPPPRYEPEPAKTEEPGPDSTDNTDLLSPPGEKSGPDFYAELLESSKESDEKQEAEDAEPTKETHDASGGETGKTKEQHEGKEKEQG
jgi:sec-independent protein translocase protein TatB